MFGIGLNPYGAGMETNATATNHLTLSAASAAHPSVAGICGTVALRFLKAIARGYAESVVYYPYWVGADPFSTPSIDEPTSR
jgi:hypothetical protein